MKVTITDRVVKITMSELISLSTLIDFVDDHTSSETIASSECKELLKKLKEYAK